MISHTHESAHGSFRNLSNALARVDPLCRWLSPRLADFDASALRLWGPVAVSTAAIGVVDAID